MIEEWSEFNVAMAGATAALVGLVIVASSVNIGEIIKSRTLTARLLAGIAALVLALAVSAISLVPGIDRVWFGVVTVFATLLAAIFQVHATRLIATDPDPADRARPLKYIVGFLHGDFGTDATPHAAHFQADDTSADHAQLLRHGVDFQRTGI